VPRERVDAWACFGERAAALELRKHKRRAAAGDAGRMVARLDVGRSDRARLGHNLCRHGVADNERLRGRQPRAGNLRTLLERLDPDETGRLLEYQGLAGQRPAVAAAFPRHDKRRTDIRVARERHLGARGEDADVGGVLGRFRRQHEGRLRQVELGRDPLHLLTRKPIRVDHHGERVAAELRVGKDVDRDEVQPHGIHLLWAGWRLVEVYRERIDWVARYGLVYSVLVL
jgi:hypothetical protein